MNVQIRRRTVRTRLVTRLLKIVKAPRVYPLQKNAHVSQQRQPLRQHKDALFLTQSNPIIAQAKAVAAALT